MRRAARVALAFAPGCALLAAAIVVGGSESPHAAAARAEAAQVPGMRAARSRHGRAAEWKLARDPFEPPPGEPREDPAPARVPPSSPAAALPGARSAEAGALPVLRALVAGERRMALLELGGRVAMVREGEPAGPWHVASIGEDAVILQDGAAQLHLRVEQTP
ncbi:MAG: hypothetical protein KGM44_06570 [bacterium]|nr:hypothetical protein [bacterium]